MEPHELRMEAAVLRRSGISDAREIERALLASGIRLPSGAIVASLADGFVFNDPADPRILLWLAKGDDGHYLRFLNGPSQRWRDVLLSAAGSLVESGQGEIRIICPTDNAIAQSMLALFAPFSQRPAGQ